MLFVVGGIIINGLMVAYRSYALLHCQNPKLVAARLEASDEKTPEGVRVLLVNLRWERRFVRFLELSGVRRTMADGTDEESAHAAGMDEWVAWETREARDGLAPRGEGQIVLVLFLFLIL